MFKGHSLFLTILIAYLLLGNCEDVIELTDVQQTVEDTNPAAMATLTQLRVKASNATSDAVNTYKCTVGSQIIGGLTCIANNFYSWTSPQNVQLKLRCPNSGSGAILSYVEINFSVSSASVNCRVHEGAVGLRYIGVTVEAWNTLIFNYSARFYGY